MTPDINSQFGPVAALLVRLGDRLFGLPLANVERVLPMAYIAPLPASEDGLIGMLDIRGEVLPVIDPHSRLGVPRPNICADHRLVLLRTSRPFLVWVDEVESVVSVGPGEMSPVPADQPNPLVAQVLRLEGKLIPMLATPSLQPRTSSV